MIDVVWGGATDVGVVRTRNEDMLLAELPIFAVADGMGGGPAGGQASEIAITELRRCVGVGAVKTSEVLDAVGRANDAILGAASAQPGKTGMGTTVVGLALVDDGGAERWLAFNVGDSRLYRLAGGAFEQISVDHSEVQELISAGELAPELRASHPLAHVVTRILGSTPPPEADCWLMHPVPGERFLLCSDGLSGQLDDDVLHGFLTADAQPGDIARDLVAAAVRAGGSDNVTAVVVHVPGRGDQTDDGDDATTAPRRQVPR